MRVWKLMKDGPVISTTMDPSSRVMNVFFSTGDRRDSKNLWDLTVPSSWEF